MKSHGLRKSPSPRPAKKSPSSNSNQAKGGMNSRTKFKGIRRKVQINLANHDAPTASILNKVKNQSDIKLISSALMKNSIFTSITPENRQVLIEHMVYYSLKSNETVFEEGKPGLNFFIIASGKCKVIIGGQQKKILKAGDSFGELALIHESDRSATIVTSEDTRLWGIDRQTFRSVLMSMNQLTYSENRTFIDSIPLFNTLTNQQKENLISSLSTFKFKAGENIVKENEPGDLFFVIKEGTVTCTQNGNFIRQMGRGEFFGEQALLNNSIRTATIQADNEVTCLAIGRERLSQALGSQLQHIIYQNSIMMAFEKHNSLHRITNAQVKRLFDSIEILVCKDNQTVIERSQSKFTGLWIILKGRLVGDKEFKVLDIIGGEELFQEEKTELFSIDFKAVGDTDVGFVSRDDIEICLGGEPSQILLTNLLEQTLQNLTIFQTLTQMQIRTIAENCREQDFQQGDIIVQQGTPGSTFYMIEKGLVKVFKDNTYLHDVKQYDYFGERAILFNENRTATVIADQPTKCWVLDKQTFFSVIDDVIRYKLLERIHLQDDSVEFSDLVYIQTLGSGQFGYVHLVAHKQSRSLYALKSMTRYKIANYDIYDNIIQEKQILAKIDNNFILKLVRTFKDNKRIYLLLEFIRGIDMFDALREIGIVQLGLAQFYSASVILMLEYLHKQSIIYRDLKPENIMIDEHGYPKLIDFGTAKVINQRTYTVIGTPQYMAPECIMGKGYDFMVDYWSLGVILYECVVGKVPFGEDEEDPYAVYELVLKKEVKFPSFFNSNLNMKRFIEQLLNKNPGFRLGGSVENLKQSKFFSGFNWEGLRIKNLTPGFIPRGQSFAKQIASQLRKNQSLLFAIQTAEADEITDNVDVPENRANWDSEF